MGWVVWAPCPRPPPLPQEHTTSPPGSGRFSLGLRRPTLQFAVHSVRVLASAPRPVDPVVAALAGLQAEIGRAHV